jgi:hypothetical protein
MYLVSGISGEPLYAAMASSSEEWLGASSKLDASAYNSAQFYSTSNPSGFIDGASASAIASAYQVVSSTATQLYAGTAYVTSVNDAPISAARAGNAANASLANSAWYDGTGRLISALPDSAAVSAIASSYVESGVSSKQDTLSFAYNTADQISSINGSALGGMDEAAVSGIASAYAESAASSKADSSALSSYALSADVSGTVDLVSTQSANWGGSALALSAGPGVKFEKSGNVLVASTDETLLWSGNTEVTSFPTTESPYNFKRLRFVQLPAVNHVATYAEAILPPSATAISIMHTIASTGNWGIANTNLSVASTGFNAINGMHLKYSAYNSVGIAYLTGVPPRIGEIYGINRTAEA